jgi:hypothetical protein
MFSPLLVDIYKNNHTTSDVLVHLRNKQAQYYYLLAAIGIRAQAQAPTALAANDKATNKPINQAKNNSPHIPPPLKPKTPKSKFSPIHLGEITPRRHWSLNK